MEKIDVRNICGKVCTLEIDPCETLVCDLKLKIQDMRGYPTDQQRLLFGGSQLEDGLLFLDQINLIRASRGISGASPITLYLCLRMRGGGNEIFHTPVQIQPSPSFDSESIELPQNNGSSESVIANGVYANEEENAISETVNRDLAALDCYGGLENGILGDNADLHKWRNGFTSDICPEKVLSLQMSIWEARKATNFIIFMIAAAAFLVPKAMRKAFEGLKDGENFAFSAILFVVITVLVLFGIQYYRLSCLFRRLNEEKQNIHVEVIRGGKRVKVSISGNVVSDVVPLKSGDKVPADGILIIGHSLGIHESRVTGDTS